MNQGNVTAAPGAAGGNWQFGPEGLLPANQPNLPGGPATPPTAPANPPIGQPLDAQGPAGANAVDQPGPPLPPGQQLQQLVGLAEGGK